MKIQIRGEHTLPQIRRALCEQLALLETDYALRFGRDVTLYLTPTNGFGVDLMCRDERGEPLPALHCDGPYACAADEYDTESVE